MTVRHAVSVGSMRSLGRGSRWIVSLRRWTRRLAVAVVVLLSAGGSVVEGQGSPEAFRVDSVWIVFWSDQRALAERTLRAVEAGFALPGIPEGAFRMQGTIVLAPTAAVFDSVAGGRTPEWSAGVAIPARRLIVLPAFVSSRTPTGDPITALRHEVAHLALHDYLGENVPRWFDEGYATWSSGEWDEGSGWQIRLALLTGAAPALDSLRLVWPRGEARARLAYLLSASAVRHLATRSGDPAFATLLATWRREGSLDAAIRSTYQMTITQYEAEWRRMVRRRYGWLLAFAQMGAFWLFLVVLLLVLVRVRRRRDRRRMAEMEAASAGDESAWWIEMPSTTASGGAGGVDGRSHPE